MNPYQVVKDFEQGLCEYSGAKYAVTTTSCTAALLLACAYLKVKEVEIPKRTYVSVPMSILHAGGTVKFRDEDWVGMYQLKPYPIWDSARWLTSGMYKKGQFICLSLHWTKTLGLGQGGVILHDSDEADEWFRRARFDGRKEGVAPKDDTFDFIGWHCYMSSRDAADGLFRLMLLPKVNEPLPNDPYPDLSTLDCLKQSFCPNCEQNFIGKHCPRCIK
jgi:dTDP-4-amino-4,6-dideoxygalactose transaminase